MRKAILEISLVCLVGLVTTGVVMEVYDSGREAGYMEGSAAGFVSGLKTRKDPPKIIIIQPKPDGSFVAPKKEIPADSVLFRI